MLKNNIKLKALMLLLVFVLALTLSGCKNTQSDNILVDSITISATDNATTISTQGGTLQFSAVVLPTDADDKSVVWSVENGTGEATINTNGLLTAVSNGTVSVKATSVQNDEVYATKTVTLTSQDQGISVTSVEISSAGNETSIDTLQGTLQFSAVVLPSDATNKSILWTVENGTGSATIDADGLLTAGSNGMVTVMVTSVSDSAINDSMVITISNQGIAVSSVTVSGQDNVTTIDVSEGTLQMIAVVLPENAEDKTVVWSVEDGTGSATISASGVVTAISNGTVIVKATSVSKDSVFGSEEITITNQGVEDPETLAVSLNSADSFTILAKTAISTATASNIVGDIGISPVAATYITGFSLTIDSSGEYSISSQVTGMIYASDYVSPTPSILTSAISDMELAYADAAGRTPDYSELYAGDLSGQTLSAGVYNYTSNVVINSNLTLSGSATDVIIIQISGSLTQASDTQIILTGGLLAENVFWQIAGDVTVGTNAHMEGTILCMTSISMNTGASINGKLFSQTAVVLDANDIN